MAKPVGLVAITVYVPPDVQKALKRSSRDSGRKLYAIVTEALREYLAKKKVA